ncbi:MAG: hypothetical protein J6R61_04555 [Bacteroidales bacterium]|nr:hypothetical protein [Bacteroidales bacterium]
MKRVLTIFCLSIATILWLAITVVPHHHHKGVFIFGSNINHSDCHNWSCEKDDNKCCDNNKCEECPFFKANNSIIKNEYNNDELKINFPSFESLYIEDTKHYIVSYDYLEIETPYYFYNSCKHSKYSTLRAPPIV